MPKLVDMSGLRIGKLLVGNHIGVNKHGAALWSCVCDCGQLCKAVGAELRTEHKRSCGCMIAEETGKINLSHGHARAISQGEKSPEYRTWQSMKRRCYIPTEESYEFYGGRGVKVCDRWLHSFEAFLEDMGLRPDGYSIDRIDSDGDYAPGNCRWADKFTQAGNRKWNRKNTSGVKNVHWVKSAKRWLVRFRHRHHTYYFGSHIDFDLAALVAAEVQDLLDRGASPWQPRHQ